MAESAWELLRRELGHEPVGAWQLGGSTPLFVERYLYRHQQHVVSALPSTVLLVQFGGSTLEECSNPGFRIRRMPTQAMLVPRGIATRWHYSGAMDFGIFYLLGGCSDPLEVLGQERGVLLPFSDELVSAAAWQLVNGKEEDREFLEEMAAVMIGQVLRRLSNPAPSAISPSHTHLSRLQEVLNHIREHPAADLSVEKLAAIAGVSVPHFFRLFQQCTGVSPHRYVLSTRLELARVLLAQSKYPISQIVEQCGFSSTSHFTSLFRQALATTPAKYRRERGGADFAGGEQPAA